MSILTSIRDWLRPPPEARQLTPAQVWGSGGIWRPISSAGVAVTPERVMAAAQGACIRLIADDISTLPLNAYSRVAGRPVEVPLPGWLERPGASRWYTRPAFVSEVVVSLLSDGNAFARGFPNAIRPDFLTVMDPAMVQMPQGTNDFLVNGLPYPETDILHIGWITLPGRRRALSVIEAAEDTTGLELAAQEYAGAFFANGGHMGGVIQAPGGPETIDAEKVLQSFEARHTGRENWWKPGILTGGAVYNTESLTPQEAALEPLWRSTLEAAARIYHIPPHMLASQQSGAASYASVEQKSIEYVQHAIVTVTARLEAALGLLMPAGQFVKFNTNALLRGDTAARSQFYIAMLQNKVMTREEVRDKEDLPYLGDLGFLETPNNNSGDEPQANAITISDVELRDEAAAQLSERVAATVAAASERTSTDVAQVQTDLLTNAQQQEERHRADVAALNARMDAAEEAQRLAALLPAEKEVIRDERGRLSGIVERKGSLTTRTVVERDAIGNVIRIRQVAA